MTIRTVITKSAQHNHRISIRRRVAIITIGVAVVASLAIGVIGIIGKGAIGSKKSISIGCVDVVPSSVLVASVDRHVADSSVQFGVVDVLAVSNQSHVCYDVDVCQVVTGEHVDHVNHSVQVDHGFHVDLRVVSNHFQGSSMSPASVVSGVTC